MILLKRNKQKYIILIYLEIDIFKFKLYENSKKDLSERNKQEYILYLDIYIFKSTYYFWSGLVVGVSLIVLLFLSLCLLLA